MRSLLASRNRRESSLPIHYSIMREVNGLVFRCRHCDFKVDVSTFAKGLIGSERTLAAIEMNKHIGAKHPGELMLPKSTEGR
jgi:hypothetical protein